MSYKQPVDSNEVLYWPEFLALADRLGINNLDNTTELSIHLKMEQVVQVTQTLRPGDHKEVDEK